MSRNLIATILAAALAITSVSANPARAVETKDIVAILGAAATLYVIGSAIQNAQNNDSKPGAKLIVPGHGYTVPYSGHDFRNDRGRQGKWGRHDNRGHGKKGKQKQWSRHLAPLPVRCHIGDSGAKGAAFVTRCLKQNYKQADRLPEVCRTMIRTDNGKRNAYKARCLRKFGYQTARR